MSDLVSRIPPGEKVSMNSAEFQRMLTEIADRGERIAALERELNARTALTNRRAAARIEALERENSAIADKATEWACKVSDLLVEVCALKQAAHDTRMAALSGTAPPADGPLPASRLTQEQVDEIHEQQFDHLR